MQQAPAPRPLHVKLALVDVDERVIPKSILRDYQVQITTEPTFNDVCEAVERNTFDVIMLKDGDFAEYTDFVAKCENDLDTVVILYADQGKHYPFETFRQHRVVDLVHNKTTPERLHLAFQNAFRSAELNRESRQFRGAIGKYQITLSTLNEIGMKLSTEKNLDELLSTILQKVRQLTVADAGSIFIVDKGTLTEEERYLAQYNDLPLDKQLVFKVAQNDSVDFPFEEFMLPITRRSLAGFAALQGDPLIIDHVHSISDEAPYSFNDSFDRSVGYRTETMLVLPMKNHEGDVIGVIQLINRKSRADIRITSDQNLKAILPFDEEVTLVAQSVASQAAVAIQNVKLLENIRNLFQSFVHASVTAIEQRDPTTSGHSERVAELSVALAKAVKQERYGRFRNIEFNADQLLEISYAAVLHDFGKVGVREQVLVKSEKLYPWRMDTIRTRHALLREMIRRSYADMSLDVALKHEGSKRQKKLDALAKERDQKLKEADEMFAFFGKLNRPGFVSEEEVALLQELAQRHVVDHEDREVPILDPEDISDLSLRYGTLNNEERLEIESHVTHTYNFLTKIPWPTNLRRIPEIAYCHHEKLNGQGYPRKLVASKIPLQSRILTVADIFDALTASDRPYKKAMPLEKALHILQMESDEAKIDDDLVRLFTEQSIFEVIGIRRSPEHHEQERAAG